MVDEGTAATMMALLDVYAQLQGDIHANSIIGYEENKDFHGMTESQTQL